MSASGCVPRHAEHVVVVALSHEPCPLPLFVQTLRRGTGEACFVERDESMRRRSRGINPSSLPRTPRRPRCPCRLPACGARLRALGTAARGSASLGTVPLAARQHRPAAPMLRPLAVDQALRSCASMASPCHQPLRALVRRSAHAPIRPWRDPRRHRPCRPGP